MATAFASEAAHVKDIGHLSAPDIARATGADETTVRAWLRGARSPSGARAERLAEQCQPAEGDRAARQRADGERRARGDRHPHAPGVALRSERLHHREAARGPGAGDAGRRRGEDEHGL